MEPDLSFPTARARLTCADLFMAMPRPKRNEGRPLARQIADWVSDQIDQQLLPPRARLPSIRWLSEASGVSFTTAVEAYELLVARGCLESRRGSGFYVRPRAAPEATPVAILPLSDASPEIDWNWLMLHLRARGSAQLAPGSGLLPESWLGSDLFASALRAVSRQNLSGLTRYGDPLGLLPLRRHLKLKLADLGVQAEEGQIIATSGVTQGMEIVARALLQPGDAVLIDTPGWPAAFAHLASLGVRMLSVPWRHDGPDLETAALLVEKHRPKLYFSNPVLHNPTGESISLPKAHRLLQLADAHDLLIFENDACADLAAPGQVRLAALDQLRRVIYASSFSKTLSPALRVGFLACSEPMIRTLLKQKMLATPTSGELGERIAHHILSGGHYRKHLARLRSRLDAAREPAMTALRSVGLTLHPTTHDGLYLWADVGTDTSVVCRSGLNRGLVFAPGCLFYPDGAASTYTRLNIAACAEPRVVDFLRSFA